MATARPKRLQRYPESFSDAVLNIDVYHLRNRDVQKYDYRDIKQLRNTNPKKFAIYLLGNEQALLNKIDEEEKRTGKTAPAFWYLASTFSFNLPSEEDFRKKAIRQMRKDIDAHITRPLLPQTKRLLDKEEEREILALISELHDNH